MRTWWVVCIVALVVWWVTSIVALASLATNGFASDGPAPDAAAHAAPSAYDVHFRYYEEVRPLLGIQYDASTALCDENASGAASPRRNP